MKFFSFITSVILLASSAGADVSQAAWPDPWNLDLYMQDGGHVHAHGRTNSGCVNWVLDVERSPMNRAVFKKGTFADTFELYAARDCKLPISFRENAGSYSLRPPRIIRSYKVY